MGLVDYISRNPYARAKKISTYDEHFVVATISKIRDSMKHLITNKQNATKKFNSVLKMYLPSHKLKRPFAPQLTTLLDTNSHIRNKAFASQSLPLRPKAPFATQLTLTKSKINQLFKHPFALQMPLNVTKSQFAPNNCKVNNSHSINKFGAKEVQISDSKECELSEQLSPIKPINGIKSNNPPNNAKFRAKAKIPKYKYHLHKNYSLFAQIQPTNHSTVNKQNKSINSNNSVNYISTMSTAKATRSKSTPTKARVTFSDTTPSTPGTITTSNTETPTGSMIEETDDMLFTETLRDILAKASECKAGTEIGKNLKSVISHLNFGGAILNEKGIEQKFITIIDRYSKYPTAEIVNNASGPNVIKFLNKYIYHHGVPRTIRLDQARCFTGKKVCNILYRK